eukprot:366171-Chlamydomonas_euryale.AAC.1
MRCLSPRSCPWAFRFSIEPVGTTMPHPPTRRENPTPRRFYGNNNVLEHIEKSTLLDDLKRREREAKERSAEANMLDTMYQVRARVRCRVRSQHVMKCLEALLKSWDVVPLTTMHGCMGLEMSTHCFNCNLIIRRTHKPAHVQSSWEESEGYKLNNASHVARWIAHRCL